jgi:hypothetical protein
MTTLVLVAAMLPVAYSLFDDATVWFKRRLAHH